MIQEKIRAARTLASQIHHFANWREVWQAYRSGSLLPALELRQGLILEHGPGDDIWALFKEIFLERCYTGGNFYRARAGDRVIDCGANIGVFSLFLASRSRGVEIHCFEPARETRRRLEKNIRGNQLSHVSIHPFAIHDSAGEQRMRTATYAGDATITGNGDEVIQCLTLAGALDRCGPGAIDLFKMDVEGAELEILGSGTPADFARIRRVALEYHEAYRPGCRDRVLKILREHYEHVECIPFNTRDELGVIRAHSPRG